MDWKLSTAAMAVVLAIGAGRADAQTRLVKVPSRILVVPPMEPGSKRVTKGDAAFAFPLRWPSAAVLAHDLDVAADTRRQTLKQGQALVETALQFADPGFANARSFCVPRLADPVAKGGFLAMTALGHLLARGLTDGQFCIVDRDGRGVAEYSVLVNAGSPAAREPRPIAAVSYTATPGAIVSEGDSVTIRYRGGKDGFELEIVEQGRLRLFQVFEYQDPSGRHRFGRRLSGDKGADGVYAVAAPGIAFRASGYDPATNSVLVEWPRAQRPAIVPIPDDIKIRYGWGY